MSFVIIKIKSGIVPLGQHILYQALALTASRVSQRPIGGPHPNSQAYAKTFLKDESPLYDSNSLYWALILMATRGTIDSRPSSLRLPLLGESAERWRLA